MRTCKPPGNCFHMPQSGLLIAAYARAACSSSFVALNDAVADLQRGRVDYAMVGGSSALFRPATTVAFNQLQFATQLSKCTWQLAL